ncbi:MAG: hypothetical protein QME49_05755 [bacterium]|nr:hypothetical protein [bacterium]
MAVEVKIIAEPTFDQLTQLIDRVRREALSDLTEFWTELEKFVAKTIEKRFDTEGHGRWEALSPAYKAWKDIHYPGMPILQRTQKLIHAATKKGAEGNIDEKTRTSFAWGVDTSAIPYAASVQSGRRAPSRIWCELEPDEVDDVNLNFGYWLRRRLETECEAYGK